MKRQLILCLLLLLSTVLSAQVGTDGQRTFRTSGTNLSSQIKNTPQPNTGTNLPPPDNDTATAENNMPKGIVFHTDIPDSALSASVFAFLHNPYEVKIMQVSHPQFDPTGAHLTLFHFPLAASNYYLGAGGMGHPHIAVYQDFSYPLGLTFKPCIHPAYYKDPQTITFWQVQRPYTLLSYNNSLNKDYQIHVTHSQNINPRWNIALDYHLFSPEGVYANSSAVDHLLDFNTNYYSRDGRYQLRAGTIWQRFTLGENGGLSDDDAFINKRISNSAGLPVLSNNTSSRSTDLTLFAFQSFNTVRQVPHYRQRSEFLTDSINKTDTIITTDTIYPSTPKTFNSGVIGLDLQLDRHKYRGPNLVSTPTYDSLVNHQFSAALFWTNDAYLDRRWRNPLKITLGIRPYLTSVALDTARYNTERITNPYIYPFARLIVSPWKKSEITALAEFEPFIHEYNLDVLLHIRLDNTDSITEPSNHNLSFRASLKNTTCDDLFYIQQHLKGVVSPELPLIHIASAEAAYNYGNTVDFSIIANSINNNIYFQKDASGNILPAWAGRGALIQARLGLNLQAWEWLHYDMLQLLQYSTNDIVRVPLLASQNTLYADFLLFHRALRTQVGVNLRYHTLYYADAYDPSLGLFYRQSETKVGNYFYADFFINLQIKRAIIYVKAGHLNSLLESESHYFALPHYPDYPFGLFYGLTWQFFD